MPDNALPPSDRPARPGLGSWALAGLFAAALFRLLWPRDISFLIDQALLFQRALADNATHAVTSYGLRGTRGLDYGPFPLWCYRALLAITHDVVAIVLIRTVAVTVVTVASLLWLAWLCPFLVPAAVLVPLLSPYLWYFARDPWDNSFLIPLAALAVASYVAFDRDRRPWQLGVAFACLTLGFLTHLMVMPLIGVVCLHLIWRHRDWLFRHRTRVQVAVGAAILVSAPYLAHLVHAQLGAAPPWRGRIAAIGFSLSGPVQLSAIGFERYLGKNWFLPAADGGIGSWAITALVVVTGMAFLLCWLGLAVACRGLRGTGTRATVCFLAFFGFLLHLALNVKMGLFSYAHYYNGVWIVFFLLLWLAVSALWSRPWGRVAFAGYTAALALSLLQIAVTLHQRGGSRELAYGPTLGNLIGIARELNTYQPQAAFVSQARHPQIFPETIAVLQTLYGPPADPSRPVLPPLTLRYRDAADPHDGRIEIAPTPRFNTPTVLR